MNQAVVGTPINIWPSRIADLADAERLILGVFRHWLVGLADSSGTQLSLAWNELARELGAARGRKVMSGLIGLVCAMGHPRRPLRHHRPCCACVSGDEITVLNFLSACQHQDWILARGQAEWLVGPDGVGGLLESGIKLSAALSGGGLSLPVRGWARSQPGDKAELLSAAVH